jgi:hypothetical protein
MSTGVVSGVSNVMPAKSLASFTNRAMQATQQSIAQTQRLASGVQGESSGFSVHA